MSRQSSEGGTDPVTMAAQGSRGVAWARCCCCSLLKTLLIFIADPNPNFSPNPNTAAGTQPHGAQPRAAGSWEQTWSCQSWGADPTRQS